MSVGSALGWVDIGREVVKRRQSRKFRSPEVVMVWHKGHMTW